MIFKKPQGMVNLSANLLLGIETICLVLDLNKARNRIAKIFQREVGVELFRSPKDLKRMHNK
jgi:hypothetical protein